MSSSTDDEELNMESEKFNPLKALYSKKLKLPPVKNFENIGMFESRLKAVGNKFDVDLTTFKFQKNVKKDKQENMESESVEVDEEKYHTTKSGRVFAKEQGNLRIKKRLIHLNLKSFEFHYSHSSCQRQKENKVRSKCLNENGNGHRTSRIDTEVFQE